MVYNIDVDYQIFEEDVEQELPLDKLKRGSGNASKSLIPDWPLEYCKYPERYFIADDKCLYCLGTDYRIPIFSASLTQSDVESIEREYPLLFYLLPFGDRQDQTIPMYDVIHGVLIGRRFTNYYKALLKFKWKTGLSSFPLFDLQGNIQVRNGRLWGWVEHKGQMCWKLLTDEVVTREIKRYGGHKCSEDSLKVKLAKELLKLHPERNIQDENPSQIDVTTPYFRLSYSPLLNQAEVVRLNGYRFHIASPSSSLQNFLRTIADESRDRLDDFAELLARLYKPSLISKYVWVIIGNVPQINAFLKLLRDLGAYMPGSAIYESDSTKALISFVYEQENGRNVQINPQIGSSSFKDVNCSRLKKFVAGEVIGSIDDPYIINGEVTGKGLLLYAVQELEENCLEKVPHKVIRISDECQFSEITADDCWWMQTCLLCHGFRLLSDAKTKSASYPLSLGDALREFVSKFCQIKEGALADRGSFHEQFKKYCNTCLIMLDNIPGPTIFSHYVERELCWSSTEVRSNKNRRAYKNIFLDKEKVSAAIHEAEEHTADLSGQTVPRGFDSYLDSFSNYLHLPGTMRTV